MEVRLAAFDDIESICRLYDEFFAYNANLQPKYWNAGKEHGDYSKSIIKDGNFDLFVAAEDDKVIGLLHIKKMKTPPYDAYVPHEYAEIVDLITTAACRKKGAGSVLMAEAKQWAEARNLNYIELTVLSDAKDAIRFYEKKDFITVSHTMRNPL